MKIVFASDSFKNAATALEACRAMQAGFSKILPTAQTLIVPMADGGEGTVQAMVDATQGQLLNTEVLDPLGHLITAQYGLLGDGQTAIIEMAAASGIQLIKPQDQNPLETTTYGTGQLIAAALAQGVKKIIIGLGGSVTNDGGAGLAQALGVKLVDRQHHELPVGGGALARLAHIDVQQMDPRLADVEIMIASDVTNPLLGSQGATVVFGPQKGATAAMVATLEQNLTHYAQVIEQDLGVAVAQIPGAGAAGGLGAGLLAFTQAQIQAGVEVVLAETHLAKLAQDADFVITGEGQIDFQTQYGKTPIGVAQAVKKSNPAVTVIAIAGSVGPKTEILYQLGIDAIFSATPGSMSLAQALAQTKSNLTLTSMNIARLIQKIHKTNAS